VTILKLQSKFVFDILDRKPTAPKLSPDTHGRDDCWRGCGKCKTALRIDGNIFAVPSVEWEKGKPKSQHSSFRHHHLPPALGVSNGVLVDETVVDDGALNTEEDENM
jgi:hypothetical protein